MTAVGESPEKFSVPGRKSRQRRYIVCVEFVDASIRDRWHRPAFEEPHEDGVLAVRDRSLFARAASARK
jgi:hypothetical protein